MGTDNFDTIKIDLRVVVLTIMVVCLTSEKCLVFWKKVFILHHGSIFVSSLFCCIIKVIFILISSHLILYLYFKE